MTFPGSGLYRTLSMTKIASILMSLNSAVLPPEPIANEPSFPQNTKMSSQSQSSAVQRPDNTWVFSFGDSTPRVICAPLHICDIALQKQENIISIDAGDSIRWLIRKTESGSENNKRPHLLVKPVTPDANTTLVIQTDIRSYHINLVATQSNYMSNVEFVYPQFEAKRRNQELISAQRERIQDIRDREERERKIIERKTLPKSGWNIEDISFAYKIRGDAPWRPTRVYSNSSKTIIEFPTTIGTTGAPTLLLVDRLGWFRKRTRQVNYRVKKNLYVIDAVFERAVLISGVGRFQHKVVIVKK